MDIEQEILREHSRRQAERIASWVGNDKKRFRHLMTLFLEGERMVAQRAAWVVRICVERNPGSAGPYLGRMVSRMRQPGVHDAVRRNVVAVLQFVDLPDKLLGAVATSCFDFLSGDAPVAVKCSSLTVLGRIAEKEHELQREIRLVIEQQLPYATAGFRARAKHVLRAIGSPSPDPEGIGGAFAKRSSD